MILLRRNLQTVWYRLCEGDEVVRDADGLIEGTQTSYGDPVAIEVSIAPVEGTTVAQAFGYDEQYDRVLLTDDMSCPINEETVMFIDTEPLYEDGVLVNTYDYVVKKVAPNLNHIKYFCKRVKTS